MGKLVQGGGGLVLSMAAACQGGEVRVVDVAVGDHIQGGDRVGQHIRFTVPVHITAVVRRGPRAGRLCLCSHRLQSCRNDLPSGTGGRLEILAELGRRARERGLRRGIREGHGVASRLVQRRLPAGITAALFRAAVQWLDCLGRLRCLGGIHFDFEVIGAIWQVARHIAVLDQGHQAARAQCHCTAAGQIAGRSNVKFVLQRLAGGQCCQSFRGEPVELEAALDAFKRNFGI